MKGAATVYLLVLAAVPQTRNALIGKRTMDLWTRAYPGNTEEIGDHFEGDILLPLPKLDRAGLLDENFRWPNAQVPYVIGPFFTPQEEYVLLRGMWEYRMKTNNCIQFISRTYEEDYVYFVKGFRECSSAVGRRGGVQLVRLDARCFNKFGTILHEMLHALGFFHEQSRTDRDNYVTVLWDNIEENYRSNFLKYASNVIGKFGTNYDYGSVMHYSEYAFSPEGKKTLVPKSLNVTIGQRLGLSPTDVLKLMNMYNCKQN